MNAASYRRTWSFVPRQQMANAKASAALWAIVFCGGKVMPGTRIQPRLQAFQFFLPLASSVGGKHDRRR
ncbi:hypothetical protein ACDY96_08490 [Rhizobium mongolense]|uniref:hypothetical protein n=1 Tax=Rhizobium mongolense TaxID=57676 RepID=UPI0035590B5A